MKSLWKFSLEHGKERGFLTLFILHSLDRAPKSGYSLLKEIGQRTQGSWIPNKGTLYPILKSLEAEGLIQVTETGKRSKKVYTLTDAGGETLADLKGRKGESEERVVFFKKMHLEIFGEENISLINFLMDVRFYVENLPEEGKIRAMEILKAAFTEIQRI
jgi:DNA-binding PadR family transcriptional regulator